MKKFLTLFVIVMALCFTANAGDSYIPLVKDQEHKVQKGEVYSVNIADYTATLPIINKETSTHTAKGSDVNFYFSVEGNQLIIKIKCQKDEVYNHFFITPGYMIQNEGFLGIYISLKEGRKITGGIYPLKQKGQP